MKDDGSRLSFSIGHSGFSINDNLTGKTIIKVNGNYIAYTLDKDIVLNHIHNLQEALMTYRDRRTLFNNSSPLSNDSTLIIRENAHYDWTISLRGKNAQLSGNTFVHSKGFDKNAVLRKINKVYAELVTKGKNLNPKRDIVRRIADAGLLVWVYDGHSIVVFEKDVSGNYMTNCMIDGAYFRVVIVSTSRENGMTTLFTTNLDELLSIPTDDSILAFYPPDEDAFIDNEEEDE